nr:hypothetical protein [Tanacetum cinerariifolium]
MFVRIGFGSTIKLVSFDKSQVVTFNSKFICDFKNSDCRAKSGNDNMVGSPHRFIIHWIVVMKNIEEVMEVIDVKNWLVDNSRVLWWIISLVEWNSSVFVDRVFNSEYVQVKEYQEKDKIESKPDKNEKRGEAEKSQKQLQSIKQEKLKKTQVKGPKMQTHSKLLKKKERKGLICNFLKVQVQGSFLPIYKSCNSQGLTTQ